MSGAAGTSAVNGASAASGVAGGAPVGFGTTFREQLRWIWRRLRIWFAILVVLLGGSFILLSNLLTVQAAPQSGMAFGGAILPIMHLVMLSWALSVWRDDPPKDRDYFWLQPVRRETHTLARVIAGLVWVTGVLIVAGIALAVVLLLAPDPGPGHTLPGAGYWLLILGSLLLSYLLGTVAAILSDKPAIWIVLLVIIVLLLDGIAAARGWDWVEAITDWFTTGDYSLGTALFAPVIAAFQEMAAAPPTGRAGEMVVPAGAGGSQPVAALLLWLVIAIGGVVGSAFASRPR